MSSFLFEYSNEDLLLAFSEEDFILSSQTTIQLSSEEEILSVHSAPQQKVVTFAEEVPEREQPLHAISAEQEVQVEAARQEKEAHGERETKVEKELEKALKRSKKMVAGSTTRNWKEAIASDFKVRTGPNYSKNKRKISSGPALYQQIGMDVIRNTIDKETKIFNIGEHIELPPSSQIPEYGVEGPCPLPRILICNIQIPLGAPKMFGKNEVEAGISLVQYFEIKPGTYREAMNLDQASPAVRQFAKFFNEAMFNDDMARRFKVVGMVTNMAQVGVPSMFQGYNGKPAIVFKTGKMYRGTIDGNPDDQYFEMDINVHEFAYLPRKAIHSLLDKIPSMDLQCAYVIQGEKDDELPERIIAGSAMFNLDVTQAVPVKFVDSKSHGGEEDQIKRPRTIA